MGLSSARSEKQILYRKLLGEISKLTKQMHAEFFREERIFTRQYENDRRKMETDFLAEIS